MRPLRRYLIPTCLILGAFGYVLAAEPIAASVIAFLALGWTVEGYRRG